MIDQNVLSAYAAYEEGYPQSESESAAIEARNEKAREMKRAEDSLVGALAAARSSEWIDWEALEVVVSAVTRFPELADSNVLCAFDTASLKIRKEQIYCGSRNVGDLWAGGSATDPVFEAYLSRYRDEARRLSTLKAKIYEARKDLLEKRLSGIEGEQHDSADILALLNLARKDELDDKYFIRLVGFVVRNRSYRDQVIVAIISDIAAHPDRMDLAVNVLLDEMPKEYGENALAATNVCVDLFKHFSYRLDDNFLVDRFMPALPNSCEDCIGDFLEAFPRQANEKLVDVVRQKIFDREMSSGVVMDIFKKAPHLIRDDFLNADIVKASITNIDCSAASFEDWQDKIRKIVKEFPPMGNEELLADIDSALDAVKSKPVVNASFAFTFEIAGELEKTRRLLIKQNPKMLVTRPLHRIQNAVNGFLTAKAGL